MMQPFINLFYGKASTYQSLIIFSVGILPSFLNMGLPGNTPHSIPSLSFASAFALASSPLIRSSPSPGGSSTEQALISAVAKSAILARFAGGLVSVTVADADADAPPEPEGQ